MPGKGSQLKRLKTSLKEVGVIGPKSKASTSKKDRKKPRDTTARTKALEQLSVIREEFNPFDLKVNKPSKYDVANRKLKGAVGRPSTSKMAGEENRRKTLLVEMQMKNRVGGIVDRRFGESDANLTPEDKMLERFTKEKQRSVRNSSAFNLEDEDELTHYGQSLSNMDDFNEGDLGISDGEDNGMIDSATVQTGHFGGFDDSDPDRIKSKAEVMSELIAKSKDYKMERQRQNQENEDARMELDDELDDIRDLLSLKNPGEKDAEPADYPAWRNTTRYEGDKQVDDNYDQFVREMAYDRRAKPQDRLKTEEEIAAEEKEALEKAEKKRLRRMKGDESESEDEDGKPLRKRRRAPEADDLEDDFAASDSDADSVEGGFGRGLRTVEEDDDDDDDDEAEEEEEDEDEDEEADAVEEDGSDLDEEPVLVASKVASTVSDSVSARKTKSKKGSSSDQVPYTFPCPSSHDEFVDLLGDLDVLHTPLVVQRIRALHHPSLAADNTSKLKAFLGVLVDHVFYLSSQSPVHLDVLNALTKPIYELTKKYPTDAALIFNQKMTVISANLTRGLGQSSVNARTFPLLPELVFFRLIVKIFPTSDFQHPVSTPSLILMSRFLGQCRIRHAKDAISGLYLCQLIAEHQKLSKRIVPEVMIFLQQLLIAVLPKGTSSNGDFPLPDETLNLHVKKDQKASMGIKFTSLASTVDDVGNVSGATLLSACLKQIEVFAKIYTSSVAFVEMFEPIIAVLKVVPKKHLPQTVQSQMTSVLDALSKMQRYALQTRKPLQLQHHRAIPIATYVPKFEENYSLDKHYDPDRERSQTKKLEAQYKKERKGAIRELRRDAQFIARERAKDTAEKDEQYKLKVRKIHGLLENEQAEKKLYEIEKKWSKSK